MNKIEFKLILVSLSVAIAAGTSGCASSEDGGQIDSKAAITKAPGALDRPFPNPSGTAASFSTTGSIDANNPFFASLGTNGRSCLSCHAPEDGWSVTPEHIQQRFHRTGGTDPIFRTNDGSVCAGADVSTVAARTSAYALLLSKGLIRVELGIPADAEFELAAAEGTYCNDTSQGHLSLFRRPLPSTNLKFIAAVMWDGRETFPGESIGFDLADQSNGATLGHAQGAVPLPQAVRDAIVGFETNLFTAQVTANGVGLLTGKGGSGGPSNLATVPFEIGINDDPHSETVFTLYDAWSAQYPAASPGQAAVARGQAIFNHKSFRITGVAGQDEQDFVGQCGTCHQTPNAGSYSVAEFFDIGIASAARRTPDLPLYTLRNRSTGETLQTSDPGRAMITGKWADIGEFKPANLRAVATRAPYFHNGSAATLDDVVNFYDQRFHIGFTPQEHADLVAFLSTL